MSIGGDVKRVVKGSVAMARVVVEQLVDDLDGGKAVETVHFSYRGVDYEVDLSTRNAKALDKSLAPYLDAARAVPRKRPVPRRSTARGSATAPDPRAVRAWARSQGIEVNDRGRVPASVAGLYAEAHAG
jgi:hypothetical protein